MKKIISLLLVLFIATTMLSCNNINDDIIIKKVRTVGDDSPVDASEKAVSEKYTDNKMIGTEKTIMFAGQEYDLEYDFSVKGEDAFERYNMKRHGDSVIIGGANFAKESGSYKIFFDIHTPEKMYQLTKKIDAETSADEVKNELLRVFGEDYDLYRYSDWAYELHSYYEDTTVENYKYVVISFCDKYGDNIIDYTSTTFTIDNEGRIRQMKYGKNDEDYLNPNNWADTDYEEAKEKAEIAVREKYSYTGEMHLMNDYQVVGGSRVTILNKQPYYYFYFSVHDLGIREVYIKIPFKDN